jgi:hypothetical protein
MWGAMREIDDRLQGRPHQAIEVQGSPLSITILSRDAHQAALAPAEAAAIDGESERLDR